MTNRDLVLDTLEQLGPILSSLLSQELQHKHNLSSVAARKRIERAKNERLILALEDVRFKHNEQFVYTPAQRESTTFLPALIQAFDDSHSPFRFAFQGLLARGGLVPKNLFASISGHPLESRKHQTAGDALDALMHWGLLEQVETRVGTCIRLSSDLAAKHVSPKRLAARLSAENILLLALRDWLRLQGLITANKASVRGEHTPQFGLFQWDFVAPSYVNPISNQFSREPGFVVADVILGRKLTKGDVQYFLHKCKIARVNSDNKGFLAWLIADWFEKDALILGRQYGYVFTTPKNLFGAGVATMLDTIVQALESKQELHLSTRDVWGSIFEAVKAIKHLEVAHSELKSILLELITGTCIAWNYTHGKTEYAQLIRDPKTSRYFEADVVFLQPDERVVVAECKHTKDWIDVTVLKTWFLESVPAIQNFYLADRWYSSAKYEFSFWTSGRLTPAARRFAESLHSDDRRFYIRDRDDIAKLLKKQCQVELSKIFDQCFALTDD